MIHSAEREKFMVKKTTRWFLLLVVAGLVSVLGQPHAYADDDRDDHHDALPYSKGFLLTGNYVVGSVDLSEQNNPVDSHGFSTGTIHMSGIPADADIVAAYMYFETITLKSALSDASGVTFRGNTVLLNDLMAVKKSKQNLTGSTASCWSSGVPLTDTMFRVDVLRWLPIRLDKDNKPTGKRLVNDADLLAHGLPLHQVKLPVRPGNHVPESAGASLFVVYRDPAQPLRKIVVYDGIYVQPSLDARMRQRLQGFYKSSAIRSAQITHIVASGQKNTRERMFFKDSDDDDDRDYDDYGTLIANDPFPNGKASSERSWASPTYNVSSLMHPRSEFDDDDRYGETATTTVDHYGGGAYDCLTWAAVIFSTAVADVDHDGIPDGLEDAPRGLKDPNGERLPNLHAMGASSRHKDIFLEFNGLWAPAGTSYGGPNAPYTSKITTLTDPNGHNHMPTPENLKMIGDAYAAHLITAHFDVGDIGIYHAPNPLKDPRKLGVVSHVDWVDDYTSTVADQYLVPSVYARGGEVVKEVACNRAIPRCQFPDFAGTVGWKFGLEGYRDQPVGDSGEEISLHPGDPNYFSWKTGHHRRRFDRNRFGLFHYVLYAHARGNPKSDLPDSPDFHHPTTASGVADLPGGNVLVTLGLWDDFVGRPFVRAATTFHETGHNLGLWHGGYAAVWGNKHPLVGSPTSTDIDPNCKPNYLSSMSYMFQVIGLFDKFDNIHLDYSDRNYAGSPLNSLNETMFLTDVAPPEPPAGLYVPAWFAPADSPLAVALSASAASRFCDGSKFGTPEPAPKMARVHAADTFSPINWSGDPSTSATAGAQNVNFDGTSDGSQTFSSALRGFNDWANIRLDQIGAGRRAVKFQDGDFADFGSGDFTDFGSGDFTDFGSGDFTDFGSGDFIDVGSGVFLNSAGDFVDFGSGDFADFGSGDFADFGSGDFADFGSGDFLDFGTDTVRQELTFEGANGVAKSAPYALTACIVGRDAECTAAEPFSPQYHRVEVRFQSSTAGHVFQYEFQRKKGDATSTDPYGDPVGTASTTKSFIDLTGLPDGQAFTYEVRTEFDDETEHTFGPWSKPVTIVAVNDAPTAHDDGPFSTNQDTALTTGNVLGTDANAPGYDTDGDSNHSGLQAVLVTGTPGLTLNPNGSFTYTPPADYEGGPVTFTYKANDGTWPCPTNSDPNAVCQMSPDSNVATVTINVVSRHTRTTITSVPPSPSTYGDPLVFMASVISTATPSLGTPGGKVQFSVDGGPGVAVGIGEAFTPSPRLSAGTHTISAKYCNNITSQACAAPRGDGLFYGSAATINYEVQQRPVSVTAGLGQGKTFGDADPALTYQITSGSLVQGDAFTGSLTRVRGEGGESVGTYVIRQGTLALSSDYALTFSGTVFFTIAPASSTTTVNCPASVLYDGSAQTPCTAGVTGAGGLSQALDVTYANNTDAGTATASASYAGDANHLASDKSTTFAIALSWVTTTGANCVSNGEIAASPEVTVSGNTVTLGITGATLATSQPICIHGASTLLPPLTAEGSHYQVTFAYELFTWDSYDAPGTPGFGGTGWWDSFSVSVSGVPYQNLVLSDPITTTNLPGLGFIWGGNDWADGKLECNPNPGSCSGYVAPETKTVTVPGGAGSNYLNVILDTKTVPTVDATHASYATIKILSIVQVP